MTTDDIITNQDPDEYLKLLKDQNIKNNLKDMIKTENETKTKDEEIEYYDTILKKIEDVFTYYDTTDLDNGKDEIIETKKMIITLTTTDNQKNNNNMTSIDLGDCEILLRNYYNLTNKTLYMKKLDIIQDNMKIPIIEYDIYSKINGNKLIKLNLTICQNSKISIIIPIKVNDNIDILNSSSGYYNDICYTITSENGTDISLKDRKNEYITKTVCQDGCDLYNYNYTTEKANCSCDVKQAPISFNDININTTKLLNNIKNIKNIANLNFLVCNKNLFNKEGLLKNISSYIIAIIIIIHVINVIIFYIKQLEPLKSIITDIIYAILNIGILKRKKKKSEKNDNINENEIKSNVIDNIDNEINEGERKTKYIEINKNENIINGNLKNNNSSILNINKKKKRNINNTLPKTNSKFNEQKIKEKVKTIMEYNDDEINELDYNLALQYDTRTFCQYYISLLKTKYSIIFSFFYNKDYNSKIIKIDLFFIGFTSYYAINALFYNDDTMHNIYVKNGGIKYIIKNVSFI